LFDSQPISQKLALDLIGFYSQKNIYKRKREQLKERRRKRKRRS